MLKSGWKTTEFWVSLLTTAGGIGSAVVGFLSPASAAIMATGSAMAYAISRGLAKKEPTKP